MDPNETVRLINRACDSFTASLTKGNEQTARDWMAEASEHYQNLLEWLQRGGFRPDGLVKMSAKYARAQETYNELVDRGRL